MWQFTSYLRRTPTQTKSLLDEYRVNTSDLAQLTKLSKTEYLMLMINIKVFYKRCVYVYIPTEMIERANTPVLFLKKINVTVFHLCEDSRKPIY